MTGDQERRLHIALVLPTFSLGFIDVVNMVLNLAQVRDKYPLWAGPITNHVGDTAYGFMAGMLGSFVGIIAERRGLSHEKARYVKVAAIGMLGLVVTAAELGGVINQPDVSDLPAIAVWMIGGISAGSLYDDKE